jgi:signal peptidase I
MAESQTKKSALAQLLGLILVVALALLLRWFVLEPRWIPSGSMLPTLEQQDRILVEKLSHRLGKPPALGDIVVFQVPEPLLQSGYDPKTALIKRVVGLPGDRLEVKGGYLVRNDRITSEPWIAEAMNYTMETIQVLPGQLWVLGDNRNASLDSHLWGSLKEKDLIGTARWRYWPLNRFGPITSGAN